MGNEKGGNPVTFHNCAKFPAEEPHTATAAALSLGSGAQRYIGPQRTRSKDRRSTTGLHGSMGLFCLGNGADRKRNRIFTRWKEDGNPSSNRRSVLDFFICRLLLYQFMLRKL